MSEKHNHITRDIKPLGQCPACDKYHDRNIPMKSNKTIAESITGISYEEIKSLANNEAKSKFLGDQLRLTYVDGYKAGFDKGAEEMAKIKDAQIEELVEACDLATKSWGDYSPEYGNARKALVNMKLALESFRKEVK